MPSHPMRHRKTLIAGLAAGALAVSAAISAVQGAGLIDFGRFVESSLAVQAPIQFGVAGPLDHSSPAQIDAATAAVDPRKLATVAASLNVRVVSTSAGANTDMMALWPSDTNPKWLLACNEVGPTTSPGFQRIEIATGATTPIVTGTSSCDGVRRTPWGSILFSEEAGEGPNGGRVYELVDPLQTTNVLLDRTTGVFTNGPGGSGAENVTARPAMGRLSFEGFAVYGNGVTYYGDELRPSNGTPAGAFYKFVPSTLRDPAQSPITSLAQSPFAAGSVYGLRLGRRSGGTDYGQGTEFGFGSWQSVCPNCNDGDLKALAAPLELTGYYRPEDIDIDRKAEAAGKVRFCGNNTGNEGDDQLWGETVCATDGTVAEAAANAATPEVQLFVAGSPELAMPDNIAFQPGRGNWVIHEDADTGYLRPHNDDLWDCLPDGADADLLSDGCIRIATLNDLTAEWTGGIFDASGKHFYVSVQHNVSGKGAVLDITGWK